MITAKMHRNNGMDHDQGKIEFKDPLKALDHLVKAELAFGGQVTGVSSTHLRVVTKILNCVDTTVFEGPEEEMRPILELVYFYLEANKRHGATIIEKSVDEAIKFTDGKLTPLLMNMMGGMLIGQHRLKVATMFACGVEDEESVKVGLSRNLSDIIAAAQLSRDGSCSFKEALSL